jgi:hypothetical protein
MFIILIFRLSACHQENINIVVRKCRGLVLRVPRAAGDGSKFWI